MPDRSVAEGRGRRPQLKHSQARKVPGGGRRSPEVIPCWHFPLANPSPKPEGKGIGVPKSVELSLLGHRAGRRRQRMDLSGKWRITCSKRFFLYSLLPPFCPPLHHSVM